MDFYLSENPDAQGALYLGSDVYDVGDYGSMITGQITYDGEFEGFLTATVTDAAGNTSQFSTAVISIDFPDEMFSDRFESL